MVELLRRMRRRVKSPIRDHLAFFSVKNLKKFKICRMVHAAGSSRLQSGIPAASMPGAAAREHIARFKTFSQMTMFASCQLDVLNQGAHGGHFNTAFAGELDCLLCCPPFCCMSC
jgi:hypothetical protein